MNKKIIIFLLMSAFLLALPKPTLAACNSLGGAGNCSRGQLRCNGNDGNIYCCSQGNGGCNQVTGGATQTTSGTFSATVSDNDPTKGCGSDSINTAIGCIPVLDSSNGTSFANFILRWAIGVGGGIAFLLILYAGFMIMTSQGNPDRLKVGQELLTSAISGLILMIFSVFILKFIGIDILKLGSFGFGSP